MNHHPIRPACSYGFAVSSWGAACWVSRWRPSGEQPDYFFLWRFFLSLFLRLCVAILWPFLFFPLGIIIDILWYVFNENLSFSTPQRWHWNAHFDLRVQISWFFLNLSLSQSQKIRFMCKFSVIFAKNIVSWLQNGYSSILTTLFSTFRRLL